MPKMFAIWPFAEARNLAWGPPEPSLRHCPPPLPSPGDGSREHRVPPEPFLGRREQTRVRSSSTNRLHSPVSSRGAGEKLPADLGEVGMERRILARQLPDTASGKAVPAPPPRRPVP